MSGSLKILIPILVFGFVAWSLAQNLTRVSLFLAHRLGAVAHPNERSSHQEPTPRIGGLGPIVSILILFIVLVVGFQQIQRLVFPTLNFIDPFPLMIGLGFFATTLGAMILGFLDDLGIIGTIPKFIGQAIISFIPVLTGLTVQQLELPFLGSVELPEFVSWILTWSWVVLMMNVVNFMDGINGLAGRFMEVFGIALVVVAINLSWRYEIAWLGAIIAGAALGYLPFNMGQARTFMGDCGSQALGALVACAGLLIHVNDLNPVNGTAGASFHDPFLTGVIICFPLIFDVLLTLVRRCARGENILKAHREHLYQRYLIVMGENHDQTLSFVSNYFYMAAIGGMLYNRAAISDTPNAHLLRIIIIVAVVGAMIYQMIRVQKLERTRSL